MNIMIIAIERGSERDSDSERDNMEGIEEESGDEGR